MRPALVDDDDDDGNAAAKFSLSDQWDRTVLGARATPAVDDVGAEPAKAFCRRRTVGA